MMDIVNLALAFVLLVITILMKIFYNVLVVLTHMDLVKDSAKIVVLIVKFVKKNTIYYKILTI